MKNIEGMQETAIEKQEMPWGGKRHGAGRKAPEGKRENISTRVSGDTARKLRAEAERLDVPIGQVIDELAKSLPEPDRTTGKQ